MINWSPTFTGAILTEPGQVLTLDFEGTRGDRDIRFPATLTVSNGFAAHDPFVFNAGAAGREVVFEGSVTADGRITLIGTDGFGNPSAFPVLTGTVNADGSFTATGAGPIAGMNSVLVVATGLYFMPLGLTDFTVTVGGNGGLPGGQPITYSAMFRVP